MLHALVFIVCIIGVKGEKSRKWLLLEKPALGFSHLSLRKPIVSLESRLSQPWVDLHLACLSLGPNTRLLQLTGGRAHYDT